MSAAAPRVNAEWWAVPARRNYDHGESSMTIETAQPESPRRRQTFPRRMRLVHRLQYLAVYEAKVRRLEGPLLVYGRPNDLEFPRIGLSVSRRVGNAVKRGRIKRLLREAFRRMRHDLPQGYDLVVSVRAHDPVLALAEYQRALSKAARGLHGTWSKKQDKAEAKRATTASGDDDRASPREA